jgi:hypothetical protein|tara:strand:- start:926 stop:1159 length:234 start_codon:yes stop_codon:yes gene_type:complete
MMSAAIVAMARRISRQFWMIGPSLILPPIRPRSSFGAAAGSKIYSRFEEVNFIRLLTSKTALDPPVGGRPSMNILIR